MKKDIFKYVLQIVICLSLSIFSFFMWGKYENKVDVMRKVVASNSLELLSGINNSKENLKNAIVNGTYTILNNSNYNVTADFVLKLPKDNGISASDLIIYYNNYTCDLSYLYQTTDDDYEVYLLKRFNLNGKEKLTSNVTLALKEESFSKVKGNSYHYKFSINPISSVDSSKKI